MPSEWSVPTERTKERVVSALGGSLPGRDRTDDASARQKLFSDARRRNTATIERAPKLIMVDWVDLLVHVGRARQSHKETRLYPLAR